MFTPEKMCLVHIVCLEKHLTKVMDIVSKSGVAHFIKENNEFEQYALEKIDFSNVEAKLISYRNRLERILGALPEEIRFSLRSVTVSPEEVAERSDKFISQLEYDASSILVQIEMIDADVEELDGLSWGLSPLEDMDVVIENLRDTRFLYLEIGSIREDYYRRFTQAIQQIPCFMSTGPLMNDSYPIIVGTPVQHRSRLAAALEAANFSKSEIPEDITGNIEEILQEIELEIWKKREEKFELQMQLKKIQEERQEMLEWVYTNIRANLAVIDAMKNIVETSETYMIPCYVPSKDVKQLEKSIEKEFDNGVFFNASEPLKASETEDKVDVPTKLKHPRFLNPFEILIDNYGYPSYSDIDPTIFAAFSFLIMFGVMFADLGHGAVLLVAGLFIGFYPSEFLEPLRKMAKLIAACGASAMVFGILFGHAFGKPLIDALWFAPELHEPESINKLLLFGVALGVFMISLGVSLNMAKAFRAKNFHEAIAGQWGLFSLLFYWSAIFIIAYKNYATKLIGQLWIWILFLVVLLMPILLWTPVSYLLGKHNEHEESIGSEIIQSAFHVFELVLGYLGNTMSYIRVAAFNLSHAGLMLAVYAVNEQLEMGTLTSLPSIIIENIFVIVLEGLIVTIQCLRLEYYEFFSKFFSGTGVKYEPLKIR